MIKQRYGMPPGMGERIAIGGYKPQYLAAVYLALKKLREGTLGELRLADLDAGRVDDLLMFTTPDELIAFQMKAESGELMYADFASQSGDSGLLADLADGWQRLRQTHTSCQIEIHFLTSQIASTSTHGNIYLPKGDPPPDSPTFAAFLQEAWTPFRNALLQGKAPIVPASWTPALDHWRRVTGLTSTQFREFAYALNLELGFAFPEMREIAVYASPQDGKDLYYYFQSQVAKAKESKQPIIISESRLQDILGQDRFREKNTHFFPVSDWYQPIDTSTEELYSAIETFESGYVALLGSPGSGKSSLLTRALVESPRTERVIRYYAYVPDESEYGTPPRGEAVNFLQDVTQQFERYGFRGDERLPELSLDLLRRKLGHQFQELAKDYDQSGRKTLILIDGLDHIAREQQERINRTLLGELPAPSQIPSGVILVLGSQHLHGMSGAILAQLQEQGRTIHIQSLNPQRTLEVLQACGVWDIIQRQTVRQSQDDRGAVLQRIYDLTQGHPLALAYLINRLGDAAKADYPLADVLESAIPYGGDIYDQYRSHWRQIEQEDSVGMRDLVGLVARLQGSIDFQWLRQVWPERQAIRVLEHRFGHFFHRDRHGGWRFFHNSFRQFLLTYSIETIDGHDPMEERRFHRILAERCQTATDRPLVHWETLYHFWKACEYEKVCDTATRKSFEQQLLALRPLEEILYDARLAVIAAARKHDAIRMFRALFILAEYTQRDYELESHRRTLLNILIDLGESAKALRWILNGQKLRVRGSSVFEGVQEEALRFSARLARSGFIEQGQSLFSLAEPLHLLRRGDPILLGAQNENLSVIRAWADAAVMYREIPDIIAQIQNLKWQPSERLSASRKHSSRFLRNRLLQGLGQQLVQLGMYKDARLVARAFNLQESFSERLSWFGVSRDLWWNAYNQEQYELARQMIDEAQLVFDLDVLNRELAELRIQSDSGKLKRARIKIEAIQRLKVLLAQDIYLIHRDRELATQWIENMQWSELPGTDFQMMNSTLDTLDERLTLYSLYSALDIALPKDSEVIPDLERHDYDSGKTILAQVSLHLARVRGARWARKPYRLHQLRQVISATLRFHHIPYETLKYPVWWPPSVDELASLFDWLIHETYATTGADGLALVCHELEKTWQHPQNQQYWPQRLRQRILLILQDYETTAEWAEASLRTSLQKQTAGQDIHGQIESALERSQIWLLLGDPDQCVSWINNAIQASLGVGYRKDYQLNQWIEWLGQWNRLDPEQASVRIEAYAHRALALDQTTEGDAPRDAASGLLRVTREWSPLRAVDLFWWLLNKGCLWYASALRDWMDWYVEQAESHPSSELAPGIAMLKALCLPLGDVDNGSFFTRLLHLIAQNMGIETLALEAERMKKVVSAESPSTTRANLLFVLSQVLALYSATTLEYPINKIKQTLNMHQTIDASSRPKLTLSDGTRFTIAEVVDQVRGNYQRLRNLSENERTPENASSQFPWEEVVLALVKELETAEAIHELADYTQNVRRYQIRLFLAERAVETGHTELACQLAMETLAAADPMGWSRTWDGGSKQQPYSILVRIDADRFRPEAFEAFADDIERKTAGWSVWLMTDLSGLFPIFSTHEAMLDVCALVEEHVAELFRATPLSTEPLDFLHETPTGMDNHIDSTIRLLMSHLSLPMPGLSSRVRRSLAEMALEYPQLTMPFFRDGLHRGETLQEELLAICETIAQKDNAVVTPIVDAIRPLTHSEHFGIAETAYRVLKLCGETVPSLEPVVAISASLASFDTILTLPELSNLAGHSLVPSSREQLAPFHLHVEALAQACGIEERTAFRMCEQLMNQWAVTTEGSQRRGEDLRARASSIRMSYIKPEAVVAKRAVHYLATRLRRQRLLTGKTTRRLGRELFNHCDPNMVLWYPHPRPTHVRALVFDDEPNRETWIENLRETDVLDICPQRDADGWIILAESTVLESYSYNWRERRDTTTVVTRSGTIVHRNIQVSPMHLSVLGCLVSDYPQKTCKDPQDGLTRLTFQSLTYWLRNWGKNWISLRPDLARDLGWSPIPEDPLSWKTEGEQLAVRSFGWQDGTRSLDQPEETGYGWCIVVDPSAWASILSKLEGQPWQAISIQRGRRGEHNPRTVQRWCAPVE